MQQLQLMFSTQVAYPIALGILDHVRAVSYTHLDVYKRQVFHGKYVGYLGVDMMIYEDESGEFGVQPCVEINLRYNMGICLLYTSRCV